MSLFSRAQIADALQVVTFTLVQQGEHSQDYMLGVLAALTAIGMVFGLQPMKPFELLEKQEGQVIEWVQKRGDH